MDRKLYIIAEGGIHTLYYMVKNGVIPDYFIQNPLDIKKYIPYLRDTDDVLIIVQGLTDFKLIELYTIINDLLNHDSKVNVTVISSVRLVKLPITYYLYDGDLFYSRVRGVTSEKIVDLDFNKKSKNGKKYETIEKITTVNKVMTPFLDYNEEKHIDIIEDKYTYKQEIKKEPSLYISLIHNVNIFGGRYDDNRSEITD